MGNRRRKKLNPKYAALPWNIHNAKIAKEREEEEVAALEIIAGFLQEQIDRLHNQRKQFEEKQRLMQLQAAKETQKKQSSVRRTTKITKKTTRKSKSKSKTSSKK